MTGHLELGRTGEQLAADLFVGSGYAVLQRNWRCPEGELDLIASKDGVVVFCEVKTRGSERFGLPAEAVDQRKQLRLRRLAARWLREHRSPRKDIRFDVVSIVVQAGRPEITHIPNAF